MGQRDCGYVTVQLFTFDKQSAALVRIEAESSL